MNTTPDADETLHADRESTVNTAGKRGTDERRETIDPAQNPAPRSPEADPEEIKKGEEMLERVKPY